MQHLRYAFAVLTMTLAFSTIASGQEMEPKSARRPSLVLPTVALAGGVVFDITSTQRAFSRGCSEGNTTFYGSRPSTSRLLTVKAATAGAAFAAMYFAHKTGHHKLARTFGYVAGGVQVAAGTLNTINACGGK